MATTTTYGPVALSKVRQAIHTGIHKASKDYPLLSEYDVCRAPEYYLTVKIADELKKLKLFVDLECSVKDTLELAGARQPGPISAKIRRNGRFDFVAHSLGNRPRFVGEVKHPVGVISRLDGDLSRICSVLRYGKESSFQAGVLAFYAVKRRKTNAHSKLLELIDSLQDRCKVASADLACKVQMDWKPLVKNDDYASASVCMVVSK